MNLLFKVLSHQSPLFMSMSIYTEQKVGVSTSIVISNHAPIRNINCSVSPFMSRFLHGSRAPPVDQKYSKQSKHVAFEPPATPHQQKRLRKLRCGDVDAGPRNKRSDGRWATVEDINSKSHSKSSMWGASCPAINAGKNLTFRLQNWDGNSCAYADIYWCKQSMELLVSLLLNVAAAYQLV